MGFGDFVRKNREYWGKRWIFGAVCEGISAILGGKWYLGILCGKIGKIGEKSGVLGQCVRKNR